MDERRGKSLYAMAVRRLVQCKDQLEDIGDIPYEKIRPVFLKLERPEQLHVLESNSPHLLGHTDEIWHTFLRRDIPNYDERPVRPKEGMSWYELYCKLKKRAEKERQEQELELMKKFQANADERDRNQTTIVNKTVHPDRKRAQRQATTHSRTGNTSLLTFGGGSRTKTNTGAGVMKKVRREVKEMSTRMGVLGQAPSRAKPIPRPSTAATPQQRLDNATQSSFRAPSQANISTPPNPYHRTLPPSANPLLSGRKKPAEEPLSTSTSSQPASARLQPLAESSRPLSASPPKRKPATKGGIFMPPAKKKKT